MKAATYCVAKPNSPTIMMPKTVPSMLRVGTMNVCTLAKKLRAVLDLARSQNLQVLCLQETRLNQDSMSAVAKAARFQPFAGTLILSQWPCENITIPDHPLFKGRVMGIKVHRPACL